MRFGNFWFLSAASSDSARALQVEYEIPDFVFNSKTFLPPAPLVFARRRSICTSAFLKTILSGSAEFRSALFDVTNHALVLLPLIANTITFLLEAACGGFSVASSRIRWRRSSGELCHASFQFRSRTSLKSI